MSPVSYGPSDINNPRGVPFAVPAIVLMALLMLPLGDRWVLEVAYIFVAFPLLICVGALSPGDRLCNWLGRLSYPLYVVQLPLSEAVGYLVKTHITQQPLAIIAASMLSCLLFSWIALVFYDEPIRRQLGLLLNRKDRVLSSAVST